MELFITRLKMHNIEHNTEKYEVCCNIGSVVNNGSANGLLPVMPKPSTTLVMICQLDIWNKLQ